jgi:hypothetical protein
MNKGMTTMKTDIIDPLDMLLVTDQRNEGLYGLEQIVNRIETVLENKPAESEMTQLVAQLIGTLGVVRFLAKTTIDNIHKMDEQR